MILFFVAGCGMEKVRSLGWAEKPYFCFFVKMFSPNFARRNMSYDIPQKMCTFRHREIGNDSLKGSFSRNRPQSPQDLNQLILEALYLRTTFWVKPTTLAQGVSNVGQPFCAQGKAGVFGFEDCCAESASPAQQGGV